MSRFFAGSCPGRERSLQSAALWQLEMDARDIDRVYGALEAFGWIDQGFIPEWYERQFDDPTAAERQTRWRAKRDRERDQLSDR
jgi:hypothetical protein